MARNKQGFTLVEIIVAIAILGVLAVIGLGAINPMGQFRKTRDASRKSDLAQIKRALLLYHNDEGEYPVALPASGNEWTRPAFPDVVYMKSMPADPSPGAVYQYLRDLADVNEYCLWATLENTTDPEIADSQALCQTSCGPLYANDGSKPIDTGTDYVVCVD